MFKNRSLLKSFTFWFTSLSVLISFIHYLGIDRYDLLFFFISFPAWVLELFVDIHSVNAFIVYFLTILFWVGLGLVLDRIVASKATTQPQSK